MLQRKEKPEAQKKRKESGAQKKRKEIQAQQNRKVPEDQAQKKNKDVKKQKAAARTRSVRPSKQMKIRPHEDSDLGFSEEQCMTLLGLLRIFCKQSARSLDPVCLKKKKASP